MKNSLYVTLHDTYKNRKYFKIYIYTLFNPQDLYYTILYKIIITFSYASHEWVKSCWCLSK